LLALQWGGTVYAWNSSRIIGLFVGFGLMILIFIGIQIYRKDKATLPLSVLKQRTVASACLYLFFQGAALMILIYYSTLLCNSDSPLVPIYFQAIKGSSPTDSGLQLLPLMLSLVVMGFIIGGIVTWWGYYTPFIIVGAAIFTIGAGLITTFTVDQANWRAYGLTIVAGAGCGMGLQNSYMSVQAVLPQSTLPLGNAAVMFSQTLS
jgi:Na+/melibiose symporter-like transporter